MKKPVRKTPAHEVREFRHRYGLSQPALGRLLGFTSNGMATYRWEREGAPYYVSLLIRLVDAYGIELITELADHGLAPVPRECVQAFREKHRLTGVQLDSLFGFASGGRATRRWEDPLERGAPTYVGIMMAYCDKFGCDLLWQIKKENEEVDQSAARG